MFYKIMTCVKSIVMNGEIKRNITHKTVNVIFPIGNNICR